MVTKTSKYNKYLAAAVAVLIMLVALSTVANADAVTDWNQRTVTFSAGGGRPGPSWVLDVAVVQLAVYDAVQAIEGDYQPYCGSIPGASGSTTAAVARAAHDVLVNRFPGQAAAITANYNAYVAAIPPADPGFAVGAAAAQCMITLRTGDGAFPIGWPAFFGSNDIGQWRAIPAPTVPPNPPGPPVPFTFSWLPDVTPFTLRSGDQLRAGPPPKLTSPEYTRAYNEVKELGALTGSSRTADQTDMANFWNGNFPGQFNALARSLAVSQGLTVSESSRLMALNAVSMADAMITAWDSKVHYNFWRPISAIQFGDSDDNPKTDGDALWAPMIGTPPYSDHTSGANSLSGSSMRALSLFFDTNEMAFQITTTNPGPTVNDIRSYTKFSEVRDEVEDARILQGIHFRFADRDARKQGEHVAQWVNSHFFRPVEEKFATENFDTETFLLGFKKP
jgi:hypothetical protein